MKKIIIASLLLCLVIITGCGSQDGGLHDIPCNADNLGKQVPEDCNTCTCSEFDGNYGWVCTEIGCTVFS